MSLFCDTVKIAILCT